MTRDGVTSKGVTQEKLTQLIYNVQEDLLLGEPLIAIKAML